MKQKILKINFHQVVSSSLISYTVKSGRGTIRKANCCFFLNHSFMNSRDDNSDNTRSIVDCIIVDCILSTGLKAIIVAPLAKFL